MKRLVRHSWPGNVRELENVIERAVALETTDTVMPDRLPDPLAHAGGPGRGGAPARPGFHARRPSEPHREGARRGGAGQGGRRSRPRLRAPGHHSAVPPLPHKEARAGGRGGADKKWRPRHLVARSPYQGHLAGDRQIAAGDLCPDRFDRDKELRGHPAHPRSFRTGVEVRAFGRPPKRESPNEDPRRCRAACLRWRLRAQAGRWVWSRCGRWRRWRTRGRRSGR